MKQRPDFSNVPTTRQRLAQVGIEVFSWVLMLGVALGGVWVWRAAWAALTGER